MQVRVRQLQKPKALKSPQQVQGPKEARSSCTSNGSQILKMTAMSLMKKTKRLKGPMVSAVDASKAGGGAIII